MKPLPKRISLEQARREGFSGHLPLLPLLRQVASKQTPKRIRLKPLHKQLHQGPMATTVVLKALVQRGGARQPEQYPKLYLLLALTLAFVYHGVLLLSGTFRKTYDAYIHIFFADHYARSWFDAWEYRWYTGFTMTSYPPGSQQSIALLAPLVGGLQNGFIVVQLASVLLITIGMYRFAKLWVSAEAAGYAALLIVFSSSITETVHVFGQLPTTFSLGFLLNALPYVYQWLEEGRASALLGAWACNAATTAGHHVTTLFGALFFVAPVIGLVLVQMFRRPLPDEPLGRSTHVTRHTIRVMLARRLRRILPVSLRAALYGVGLVTVLVVVVLPYWLYSKSDPIAQVSIPHASRDSFLVNTNAGLIFWLVPYGLTVLALPYIFYKGFSTKAWPLALSLALLVLLGTGGTTPIPRLILGSAFDILTLDRFTFWATICLVPLLGELVVSLRSGGLAKYLKEQFGTVTWRGVQITLLLAYFIISILTANLTQFRQFEPKAIETQPIVNFLGKDQHSRWRYLTLGFGDQMAWLAAQTTTTTVDGNYNSARRLPELTTSPVERLEGAKYSGIAGIGSLQQILAMPEKYNLKFVFSNDQFYDPLLYFSGWHRLQRLENGIMVWERADIPPLPEVLPRKDIPVYQSVMWGIVPMTAIFLALFALSMPFLGPICVKSARFLGITDVFVRITRSGVRIARSGTKSRGVPVRALWLALDRCLLRWSHLSSLEVYKKDERSWQPWLAWHNRVARIKQLQPAPPNAQQVRSGILCLLVVLSLTSGILWFFQQSSTPIAMVQHYYDDIDFRRYDSAYAHLDPLTRPSFEQYMLELSVVNGLVASYGKLNSIHVVVLKQDAHQVEVRVDLRWMTALAEYPTSQRIALVARQGSWYILPHAGDITIPPDQFVRQGGVLWHSQGRSRVTTGTTSFGDVLDRPVLQVLSARLVKANNRYSIVGELINTDTNPGDVTVTAVLFDAKGTILTTYNAQTTMIHKLFPKELTPFRVDFEGVAGVALNDTTLLQGFRANTVTPPDLHAPIVAFDVYAKAVVTDHDLYAGVETRNVRTQVEADGKLHLVGELFNTSTFEATIPHVLLTYYDANLHVAWVDSYFLEQAVEPERMKPFDVVLTSASRVTTLLDNGKLYSNALADKHLLQVGQLSSLNYLAAPPGLGYTALGVNVNSFVGNG